MRTDIQSLHLIPCCPPPHLGHNIDSCIRLSQIWILRLIINTAEIEDSDRYLLVGLYCVLNSLHLDKFQMCRSKNLLFQLFSPVFKNSADCNSWILTVVVPSLFKLKVYLSLSLKQYIQYV